MHVSDPFFIKRTWIFCCYKMKNAHILLQITVFCSISLWNDLSVRVVTYDWTVVFALQGCRKSRHSLANTFQEWQADHSKWLSCKASRFGREEHIFLSLFLSQHANPPCYGGNLHNKGHHHNYHHRDRGYLF